MTTAAAATIRAAAYLRISLDPTGEALGVARQRDALTRRATDRGWVLTAEYEDNDLSAAGKVRRPRFEALLDDIAHGRVDIVMAYAFDRLARTDRDKVRLVDAVVAAGVRLVFVNGGDLDPRTKEGRVLLDVLGMMAREEILDKSARHRLASAQRAERGIVNRSARRSFGWKPDKVTPDPHEAPYVIDAFRHVAAGGSLRSVAKTWNAKGLKGPQGGRAWTVASIRAVLSNPHNAGLTALHGVVKGRGDWPALVDDETWEAVQARLAPTGRTSNRGIRSLLGSIATCPCGAHVTHAKGRGEASMYRHQRPAGERGGDHVARAAGPVDDFIGLLVVGWLSRHDQADLLRIGDAPDLEALLTRRLALQGRIDEADEMFAAGEISRASRAKISERVQADLNQVDVDLAEASKAQVLLPGVNAADPYTWWEQADLDTRRAVIRELFADIRLGRPGMGPKAATVENAAATVEVEWRR